jgi:hypothetical protein
MLVMLGLLVSVFPASLTSVQASAILPARSYLTCYLPWDWRPRVTNRVIQSGNPVSLDIGISGKMGGVATELWLKNDQAPNSPAINVIESRSAGGAGWQFSSHTTAFDGVQFTSNQATGNRRGYQWGYSTAYTTKKSDTLTSVNWAPNDSDSLGLIGTSPCESFNNTNNPVVRFDEGQMNITSSRRWTPTGYAVNVTNAYSLRSLVNQHWSQYLPTQAIYFSRTVARQQMLRLYLISPTWVEGPIDPYHVGFSIRHAQLVVDSAGNPSWLVAEDAAYAVFIWRISGLDVAMVIPLGYGANLSLEQQVYCDDANNDTCGSIRWITNAAMYQNAIFTEGSVRAYPFEYLIGTPQQLAYLGYPIR